MIRSHRLSFTLILGIILFSAFPGYTRAQEITPPTKEEITALRGKAIELLELFQIQNDEGPCLDCFNSGMVIGLLPVVGVPLPLVSYGGTAMVTLMAGFGILMSLCAKRKLVSR